MVEWAARKLLSGQNPYVADYLDTPLVNWPMVNNPALYHLTYFPSLFLITVPFVWVFDHFSITWDERYLYLPAFIATLAILPLLVKRPEHRLALVALVALNPQLFPFVVEGRNDFFVLAFLFAPIARIARDRGRGCREAARAVLLAVPRGVARRDAQAEVDPRCDRGVAPPRARERLARGHVRAVPRQRFRRLLRRRR